MVDSVRQHAFLLRYNTLIPTKPNLNEDELCLVSSSATIWPCANGAVTEWLPKTPPLFFFLRLAEGQTEERWWVVVRVLGS
jgi:hypothetical protein